MIMKEDGEADGRPSAASPRRQLVFHSEKIAEPFREHLDGTVSMDVESVVQLDDGTQLQYLAFGHRDPQRLVETVEQLPTTLDVELMSTVGDTHRFEVHAGPGSLFGAFTAFDGTALSVTFDADGVEVVGEFPGDVDADAVLETVREAYPDLELVDSYTVETVDTFRYQIWNRLTKRQLTVLQVAYFSGYYEQPRQRTGTELADRLGISKQAFHDHLRKAHATVFEVLIGNESELGELDT